jgi:outer membrane lipoprotein SlyB
MNITGFAKGLSVALLAAGLAASPSSFAACVDCGTVTDVKLIKKEGEASGAGAVIGGIAGGVLGHQMGSGRGRDVATVAGAAGGAYVGHQVEKSKNAKEYWQVSIKMDDGKNRYFNFDNQPAWRAGDKVKIVDKKLMRQ